MTCAIGFFRDRVTQLAGEASIELILGHGFEDLIIIIRARAFGIEGDVERLRGHRDFIYALPWQFEIRSARTDDAKLRVGVTFFLLLVQRLRNGIFERRAAETFGAAERGDDRALILVDGIDAGQDCPHDKVGEEAQHRSNNNRAHAGCLPRCRSSDKPYRQWGSRHVPGIKRRRGTSQRSESYFATADRVPGTFCVYRPAESAGPRVQKHELALVLDRALLVRRL
jgi:hypothetical protein